MVDGVDVEVVAGIDVELVDGEVVDGVDGEVVAGEVVDGIDDDVVEIAALIDVVVLAIAIVTTLAVESMQPKRLAPTIKRRISLALIFAP